MFTQTLTCALSRLGLDKRGSDPHPRQPAPMLLHKADGLFADDGWSYEPKWDGFRVLTSVRDGSVRLISRNGASFTHLFGPITDALRGFPTLDRPGRRGHRHQRPGASRISRRGRLGSGPGTGQSGATSAFVLFDILVRRYRLSTSRK